MSRIPDGAAFRRSTSVIFNLALVALALVFVACLAFGWVKAGWLGLLIGAVVGFIVAGGGAFIAVFVFAMSQDGA